LTKNKTLRVAVRLALKKLGERGGDQIEGKENLSETMKCEQIGRSQVPKLLENTKYHLLPLQDSANKDANGEKMDI